MAEVQSYKLWKAQEYGYDSTWSEVENALETSFTKADNLFEKKNKVRLQNLYIQLKKSFGIIGVLLVLNLRNNGTLA
mgnify:FL=1